MIMGVQALKPDCLIAVDEQHYREELALKNELLANDYPYYFQAPKETAPLQWDVLALLLANMTSHYPQHFVLRVDDDRWTWQNALLGCETTFKFGDAASLPLPPLDWLGRQVQEDLLILSDKIAAGLALVAGQLCFPNAWCLDDKMGKSFLAIHREVPQFAEHLGRSSLLLLERLKVGHPVWRMNWAFKASSRLNLTPRFSQEVQQSCLEITTENIAERCFLRVERQTLSRLPRTNGILFTIHTYQTPVATVAENAEYARLIAGVVRTTPTETLVYKGMAPFAGLLLRYLETRY